MHTKEPWRAGEKVRAAIYGADGSPICVTDSMGECGTRDGDAANAARIVACVNACEGVSTEDLEIIAEGGESWAYIHRRLTEQVQQLTAATLAPLPREGLVLVTMDTGSRNEFTNNARMRRFIDLMGRARADGHTSAEFIVLCGKGIDPITFHAMDAHALNKMGLALKSERDELHETLTELMTDAVERSPTRWQEAKRRAREVLNRVRRLS